MPWQPCLNCITMVTMHVCISADVVVIFLQCREVPMWHRPMKCQGTYTCLQTHCNTWCTFVYKHIATHGVHLFTNTLQYMGYVCLQTHCNTRGTFVYKHIATHGVHARVYLCSSVVEYQPVVKAYVCMWSD